MVVSEALEGADIRDRERGEVATVDRVASGAQPGDAHLLLSYEDGDAEAWVHLIALGLEDRYERVDEERAASAAR
jgi:hypothetical protein